MTTLFTTDHLIAHAVMYASKRTTIFLKNINYIYYILSNTAKTIENICCV